MFFKGWSGCFFLATHYTETFLHFVSQHFFVSFFSSNCSIFFGKQVAVHRWRWLVVGDFSFFRNFLFLKGEGYFFEGNMYIQSECIQKMWYLWQFTILTWEGAQIKWANWVVSTHKKGGGVIWGAAAMARILGGFLHWTKQDFFYRIPTSPHFPSWKKNISHLNFKMHSQ